MGSSNWGSAGVQPGANQRAKIFVVKFIRVKYFRTISVSENIFATNKKRITVCALCTHKIYCCEELC